MEGSVVDELSLFNDLDMKICAFFVGFHNVTPVEEVVVVDHAATEVGLAEDRDVIDAIVVGQRLDETIAQAGFTRAYRAFIFFAARKAHNGYGDQFGRPGTGARIAAT